MSYSLSLQRFRAGQLAAPQRTAALAQLRRQCADAGGPFETYDVGFPDGSRVEFVAHGLASGSDTHLWWDFRVREFSAPIVQFIHDIAQAGDCVIWNSRGSISPAQPQNPLLILMHLDQAAHLPKPCPNTAVCQSARHLEQLLRPGFDHWQASFRPRRSWLARLLSLAEG